MNKESKITDSENLQVQCEHCELIAEFEESFANWENSIDKTVLQEIIAKNNAIDTPFKLAFAYDLINTCIVDNSVIANIDQVVQEMQHDTAFKELWLSYTNSGKKLNLTKTRGEIEKKWLDLTIDYDGKLNYSDNMELLTNSHNLPHNVWGNSHKVWTEMLNRKVFVIKVSHEKLGEMLFPVQIDENNAFFILGKGFSPMLDQTYSDLCRKLWKVIVLPENQRFFQRNYKHGNEQLLHQHQEVLDLIEEL